MDREVLEKSAWTAHSDGLQFSNGIEVSRGSNGLTPHWNSRSFSLNADPGKSKMSISIDGSMLACMAFRLARRKAGMKTEIQDRRHQPLIVAKEKKRRLSNVMGRARDAVLSSGPLCRCVLFHRMVLFQPSIEFRMDDAEPEILYQAWRLANHQDIYPKG